MALATWWRGDALPSLVPVPGFPADASRDEPVMAAELRGPNEKDAAAPLLTYTVYHNPPQKKTLSRPIYWCGS